MSDVTNTYYPGAPMIGLGSQLLIGQNDGDPETFTAVVEVMEITPGDMTTEMVDTTHLRSPEFHREQRPTLRMSGPFGLSGNWRPRHGSQSNVGGDGCSIGLLGLWRTRAQNNFKLQVPTEEEGDSIALTGIAQVGGLATATSTGSHGLTNGDMVRIAGAAQGQYNGVKIIAVLTATTFTYSVATGTVTPATGTMTAVPLESIEWPFRGVVSKFQPGTIGLVEKVPFTAEISPLQDNSAVLP